MNNVVKDDYINLNTVVLTCTAAPPSEHLVNVKKKLRFLFFII